MRQAVIPVLIRLGSASMHNSVMIHRKLACHCHCSYLIGFAAIAKMLIKIA